MSKYISGTAEELEAAIEFEGVSEVSVLGGETLVETLGVAGAITALDIATVGLMTAPIVLIGLSALGFGVVYYTADDSKMAKPRV